MSQHPNIFLLINHLKVQQACASVDYERLKLGQKLSVKSKKDLDKEFKLELVKAQYKDSDDMTNYMLALSQLIQYPYEYWFDSIQGLNEFFDDEESGLETVDEVVHEDNAVNSPTVIEAFQESTTYANLETVCAFQN